MPKISELPSGIPTTSDVLPLVQGTTTKKATFNDLPISATTQAALNLKADANNPTFTGTVTGVSKAAVGLGNVDNTSDVNKPVSTAQQTAITAATPPGAVLFFAMNTAPTGWLKANGALVSRTTFAALFAAIGTTFGAGDGSTTFGLPDLRGEFVRGWDDGRGVDSGRTIGSSQGQAIQSHQHATNQGGDTGNLNYGNDGTPLPRNTNTTGGTTSGSLTATTGGTETRPRNVALLGCIKT